MRKPIRIMGEMILALGILALIIILVDWTFDQMELDRPTAPVTYDTLNVLDSTGITTYIYPSTDTIIVIGPK